MKCIFTFLYLIISQLHNNQNKLNLCITKYYNAVVHHALILCQCHSVIAQFIPETPSVTLEPLCQRFHSLRPCARDGWLMAHRALQMPLYPEVLAGAARALRGLVKSNSGSYFILAWRHRLACSRQQGLGAMTVWAYLLQLSPSLPLSAVGVLGQIIRSFSAVRFSLRPALIHLCCIQSNRVLQQRRWGERFYCSRWGSETHRADASLPNPIGGWACCLFPNVGPISHT